MNRIYTLKQVDIFYDLSDEQIAKLSEVCEEKTYHAGALIFDENEPGDELYVIGDGKVEIQVDPAVLGVDNPASAGPTTISTLRPGQVFGEVALVDQGLRSAAARSASNRTRLLVIKRDDFDTLCEEDHQLGYKVMRNIAADLALKIRNTDMMVRGQLLWSPRDY